MSKTQQVTPEEALEIIYGYQKVPNQYIEDVYGSKLWGVQKQIVDAVFKNRLVAVKTCNAIGKSYVAARIAHAFLDLHPGSIVVTTAPTFRQVSDILWREFGAAHNSAIYPMGGRLSKTGLEYDKDWYAIGLSTNEPEKFFGYHADHILVVADEASGIDEQIFDGIRAITPNRNAHTLLIGNPTNKTGTFGKWFDRDDVVKFTVSAFDTPNFQFLGINTLAKLLHVFTPPAGSTALIHKPTKNIKYPIEALISPEAVYERYLDWGPDSPMWQALILGEFPTQAENTLIPLDLILGSMDENYRKEHGWNIEESNHLEYGIDVARYGSDRTVVTPRKGGYVMEQTVYSRQSTTMTTDRIIESLSLEDWLARIKIDDSTMGGGVVDQLIDRRNKSEGQYHYTVVPILFNNKPNKPRFYDMRAEMYWTVRELFYNHAIALPKDNALANELASVRYEITPKGQIRIEDKAIIKKRDRQSPDKADSLVLAFSKSSPSSRPDDVARLSLESMKRDLRPTTAGIMERY